MPRFLIVRNHAPWQKSLIIPLWISQLAFLIAVFALAVASLVHNGNYRNYLFGNAISYTQSNSGATTIFGLDTGLSVAAIALTFTEAFRLATRSLSPALFLLSNIIKLVLFIVLIGLDGDGIRRGYDRHRVGGIAAFVLDVMAILMILVALSYAIIILLKIRRVDPSSNYGVMTHDSDKPETNPVSMHGDVPNNAIQPDISYNTQQIPLSAYESYRQATGTATPAPRYQSYYSATDPGATPPPRFHELEQYGTQRGVVSTAR